MSIRAKLTLAFLSVVLIVAFVGYYSVGVSETALQEAIGDQSVVRAREMLSRIDASIYRRIEQLRAYAEQLSDDSALIASNREFEGLGDVEKYVAQKDRAWQAAGKDHVTPFMSKLIGNRLSREIRRELEQKDFYNWLLGYELFGEVFVTNKYGANVAQTRKTSDYNQADEEWWMETRKNGMYVADVEYDRSAGVYSTDICIRVNDRQGEFIGVLKAVVDLNAVISSLKKADKQEPAECKLLTADLRVIYSTRGYPILEPLPVRLPFDLPHSNAPNWMNYFIAEGDKPGEDEKLYAFARSSGFREYEGLGWVLVVEHSRKAILAPVATLRNRALWILLGVTVLALFSGVMISRFVANSLKKLTAAAASIGEGDLTVRVRPRSKDEVGQLARVFNEMASSLQASRDNLTREVAERRRSEEALRDSEEQFRQFAGASSYGFGIGELGGRMIYTNAALRRILHAESEGVITSKTFFDFYTPQDAERLRQEIFPIVMEKGQWMGEIPILSMKGNLVATEQNIFLISEGQGTSPMIGNILTDITDRKRAEAQRLSLERQVQYAQKLESLGVLAGGIAHDFNNILMIVLGNADLAMDALAPHDPSRENISEISKAAKRVAELSRQMLAYSGRGRLAVEPIDLEMLVGEMAHLLDVSISKKTVLKYDFADNLPAFDGDPTQIRQVIMNLIINAAEAVGDDSGVVTLSTGAMDCDRSYLDSVNHVLLASLDEELTEGRYVWLEVADTGCGMDAETIEKVFDPFFTTKFTGRGLGMSAVLGIIRGHHGAIRIESQPGKGATFTVLFPASELSAGGEPSDEPDVDRDRAWSGRGTVLVADDEESILATAKESLERMGFGALTAADGRQAVELFEAHADEIVCVLLDLTMPHMGGQQAFGELRRIRPDVKVVICSGYNQQEATRHFAGKGLSGFIQKPYTLARLRDLLMEILPGGDA